MKSFVDGSYMIQSNTIKTIDCAFQPYLDRVASNTLDGNPSEFCQGVCDFYKALFTSVMHHNECLMFTGNLAPEAVCFLTFFIRHSLVEPIWSLAPSYDEWLDFFLMITERIYTSSDDEPVDCRK